MNPVVLELELTDKSGKAISESLNIYQQEFLRLQTELINEETDKLLSDDKIRKRNFDRSNDDWHDNFLGENY